MARVGAGGPSAPIFAIILGVGASGRPCDPTSIFPKKSKVGYEIPFTRTFYEYKPIGGKSVAANTYAGYLLVVLVKSGYVDFVSNKATIPHFTKEKVGGVPLPLPSPDEQRAIAAYLDRKCAAIDRVVAEKEGLIADLEQYKKSLIFECVTGKREVA